MSQRHTTANNDEDITIPREFEQQQQQQRLRIINRASEEEIKLS